jgi:uncharacterized repeat protein (TIGR03803 family)
MPPKPRLFAPVEALVVATMLLTIVSGTLAASKYKVLHAFTGGNDGGGLYGGLLLDEEGNVYGETVAGGPKGKGGTAFRLEHQANGKWAEAVLYNFCSEPECRDGGGPMGGLIFDPEGSLYGTTESGGGPYKYGTVFELSPGSDGWKETTLHRFGFNKYGCCPQASLVMDSAGNLFGTAHVAFELSPTADGWKETVLHDFTGQNGDGYGAYTGMTMDAAGNLYGETLHGGTSTRCGGGCGTAYQLQRTADGWKERILHDFGAIGDGAFPLGTLSLDSMGNLYGTTGVGGATGNGTVYRLTLQADGHWKETIVYSLTGGANGIEPGGGVVMDKAGNLYGTTTAGGSPNCECGIVYKLSPAAKGKWNFNVLHTFVGTDGAQPVGELILDDKGNLYGNTITGGAGGYGVAFELTP